VRMEGLRAIRYGPPGGAQPARGGSGFVLNEAILGLEWSRVSLVFLVFLGVGALSEAALALIRRRLA